MNLPPLQNNYLAFLQNNTWHAAAQVVAMRAQQQNITPLCLFVRQPAHLPAALAQRDKPVIIENVKDNRILWMLLAAFIVTQGLWLIGDLAAVAISKGYGVEFSQKLWIGKFGIEHKLILTPRDH
jgi:hypothetical protein